MGLTNFGPYICLLFLVYKLAYKSHSPPVDLHWFFEISIRTEKKIQLSLVLLLISNLTNGLRLHQFLVTRSEEANKSVKTDANGAH